ncbi:hypothetical protein QJ854_gp623 [Moumouvirus goulette]|uniref:Uncharacterized protein n=1 Tax=Moumouvirus goulette TaxID=1247379 RepID=M1PB80_9VIRU|nr:hypothetical protein QJ854_gp623 [Moumouvirus goulette]AGF85159.1 hypothetical protein glt_00350 [Moumouvirus goulette]
MENINHLTIGIIGDNCENTQFFLKNYLFDTIKISKNFKLEIMDIVSDNYSDYNYIFYSTGINKLENKEIIKDLEPVISKLSYPHNHLFIIIDNCHDLEFDDDGDLVFKEQKFNNNFYDIIKNISNKYGENIYDICKISTQYAIIYKSIIEDGTIVNLSDDQIDTLALKYLKSPSSDLKKQVKIALKKIDLDEKLLESGYNELREIIIPKFKLVQQKKIVYQNYLYFLKKLNIELDDNLEEIINLIIQINSITFMKDEMLNNLKNDIDNILCHKFKIYDKKLENNNIREVTKYQKIFNIFKNNINEYHKTLSIIQSLGSKINSILIENQQKEIKNIVDLSKIINIISSLDKNVVNVANFFNTIIINPKIINENLDQTNKWLTFIDKSLEIGIDKESIIKLLHDIIIAKALYYSDITRCSNIKDVSILYPQCLNIFLLSNLNTHFIFKKLYMFIMYSIRYSGKNIADYIKNISQDEYNQLLVLENKLLQLCL